MCVTPCNRKRVFFQWKRLSNLFFNSLLFLYFKFLVTIKPGMDLAVIAVYLLLKRFAWNQRRKRTNISFLAFVAKFAGYSIFSVFSLTVAISFFLELISYISCFHAWLSLAVFRVIFRRSNFFYVNFIHLYLYSTNNLMRILRVLVCLWGVTLRTIHSTIICIVCIIRIFFSVFNLFLTLRRAAL